MLGDVNKLFFFKSLLTTPTNVLPLHLKQTFPPIIWIFNEGEGDGIKFRLPFKIFSTLSKVWFEKNWLVIQIDFWQVFSKLRQVHSCLEKWMSCWWSLLGNWGLYSSWIGRCSTSQKGTWSWRSDNSLKFVNKNAYYLLG